MVEENGIYVFCCIQTKEEKNYGMINFEGEEREIFTIHYRDAAMVAIEAPIKIYHPKKKPLMTHQQVISRVMEQESSVIPISFGNVFNTKEDTQALTENLYPQLKKLFVEVKNKIEIGLKVIGKREWLEEQIQQNTKIVKKKDTVAQKSKAAGYFDRIQLGEMARDFFTKIQRDIEETIHDPLSKLSEASKLNDPLGEKMLLNGAYLIDREYEESFDDKVNELHERWKDYVDFKYTGPWPAYNFINIKLKVEAS
ncbi:Gas vesicle synthesis protein GvpL/GvpF [Halobacillus karajensis]|uniref:GvpL/GvpF family gas vesicle protein n=1 Tax=Halobacillus karajensis TaxID=195088 RepID=UPI0008A74944|nr:GvpL/GvpF family gas vesicle protein [Halobacillus karajensis]SEH40610.1 Gas vesicle synthesis protein GvpL/GvpF [Halobacillus karajensis]